MSDVVQDIAEENGIEKIENYNLVQTEGILEGQDGWEYKPSHNGFPGTLNANGNYMDAYSRKIPETFVGEHAHEGVPPVDKFTQNMLNNYAIEGKDKDAKPTGLFWITDKTARTVANEIACTHYKMCGEDADKWLDSTEHADNDAEGTRYEVNWKYYDVNGQGQLDAIGMIGNFYRHMFRPLGELHLE